MEGDENDMPAIVKDKTTFSAVLDAEFLRLVRTPIARGGVHGIAGNGKVMSSIEVILRHACEVGYLPQTDDWKQSIGTQISWPSDYAVVYFACPCCPNSWM